MSSPSPGFPGRPGRPGPPGPPGPGRLGAPPGHDVEGEEATGAPGATASREWIHESGYSKRAPVQHVREDVQRVQRQSEEKYRKLMAEKREAGLSAVRSGGSHALGTSGTSTATMHEARQKLARDLERKSNPRLRKEEERRKAREESQRERMRKEQERQRQLQERQANDAVQNRLINDAKREHWQAWDASLPRSTAPPESRNNTPPAPEMVQGVSAEITGTWHLKQGRCYYLFEANGDIYFDGPPLPSGDPNSRLLGRLVDQGPTSWRTELNDSRSGQHVGVMSFRMSASGRHLMTCFKAAGKEQGKEITASREVPTTSAASAPTAPAPTPGSDGVRGAMRTNYMDRLIDPGVWQCQRCTFINNHGGLCDACGSAPDLPPDPNLASMDENWSSDSHGQVPAGSNGTMWQCPTCTLENEPSERCCGACETIRPDDVMADVGAQASAMPALAPVTSLVAWLRENGLEEYEDRLETQGYADLQDLLDAEPVDIERMLVTIEALPGHILRFKNCLRRSRKN